MKRNEAFCDIFAELRRSHNYEPAVSAAADMVGRIVIHPCGKPQGTLAKASRIIRNALCMMGLMLCLPAGIALAQTPETIPPPEITVPLCEKAPVIDGVLDDACWTKGAEIRQFYLFGQKGKTTSDQRFCLVWDNQWLYLAAEIAHPMPQHIKPKVLIRDAGVQSDDSIEIFIDPGTDGKFYDHFLLNAANVRAEQRKFKTATGEYGGDRRWDVPWRSATKITEKGWQAEAAIPMSELAAQGGLERLRMNIVGTIWKPVIDAQMVEIYRESTPFTWAPMTVSFHEPYVFGKLRGLEQARPEAVFLPTIRLAEAGNYVSTNGQYGYEVSAELQGYSPVTGAVNLVVTDEPLAAGGTNVSQTIVLNGIDIQRMSVFVPVSTLGSRTAKLALIDAAKGELLQTIFLTDLAHLSLMTGVYVDRLYYTAETQAMAGCSLSLPEDALKGCALRVRDAKDKTLGSINSVKVNPMFPLALDSMPTGSHKLKMELLNARGQVMISQSLELIKRAPKPGLEWKTDRINGVVLRNGEPFFPYGFICASTNEASFKEVAGWGMNSVWRWVHQDPTNTMFLALAVKYNLTVVVPVDFFAKVNLTSLKGATNFGALVDANMDRMLAGVERIKDSPALMAYFQFDEPGGAHQIEPARKMYRLVNEVDGYHPWAVGYSSYIPAGDQYLDWSDIVGTDPYWVPCASAIAGVRGTVNFVSKITAWTKRRGDGIRHPTIIVPVGELWSGMRKRIILPEEQMCQSYLAIIHGAKGLFYFCYPFSYRSTAETMARLGQELKALGPIAVTPDVPQTIKYQPGEFNPDKDLYPDVQVSLRCRPNPESGPALRSLGEGGYVLLAANSRPYPVDATFRIAGLADKKISRLFSKETYKVKEGEFKDSLEPYATRAYVISEPLAVNDKPSSDEAKIAIAVETKDYPEKMESKYAMGLPDIGRPGKRNIARNPSMEEASIPDCADYMIWLHDNWGAVEGGVGGNRFGRDTKTAWHGKASMRITGREGNWKRWLSWWQSMQFTLAPQPDKPTRYVFSAYLKASKDGIKARLTGLETISNLDAPEAKDNPEFTLTTDWKRYSHSGIIKPGLDRHHQFGVSVYGEGTVWIDAVQVEQGAEPTEFEP